MTLRLKKSEFRLLRNIIETRCGIFLGEEKEYLVEHRLTGLAKDSQCKSFGEFCRRINKSPPSSDLWNAVIDAITINETLWLRDLHPFTVLREDLLPKLHQSIREGKRNTINIWSAACSTGQEPYSIAMTALDYYENAGGQKPCRDQVRILATDISSAALSKAAAGQYDNASIIRGLPQETRDRYFTRQDDSWAVKPSVKQLVAFKMANLLDPLFGLGRFDIVFLRNLIIYFSEPIKKDLLERIAGMIKPGGYLVLGAGETVRGYTSSFNPVEYNGCILYRAAT
jgi:chemotaxis protein methyltransferase CheR